MKKNALLIVMFIMFTLGLSLRSNATLGPIVTDHVNSYNLYNNISKEQTFQGKTYKSGIIDNYHVVVTSGVADIKENQIICFLTERVDVDSNTKTVSRTKINTAPTFVAFDETKIKDAYAYTLLYGLKLCTDEYTASNTTTTFEFYCNGRSMKLSSTSIVENHANYTFENIPAGTKKAQLLLKGDIIAITITIKNYQKLWFGVDNNFKKQINAYICCNTYEYEDFTAQ